MSKAKSDYHMPRKTESLPLLQKKIIIHLAENGPQTVNETVNKIEHHYKPTWIAFQSLERKGLIKKVNVKLYRGREYPQFWLSEDCIILAFIEGASKNALFKKTKEVYPANKNLHAFLDFASIFNPEVWEIAYYAIRRKGTLEPIDLATIMFTQMDSDVSIEKIKEGLIHLKKYPEMLEFFKKYMESLVKVIECVLEVLEHE
ncbi:MAG: hypothetical protein WHU54_01810 [Candidatus Bathyarchaeia archaeon]|jgi:hypothetical protein